MSVESLAIFFLIALTVNGIRDYRQGKKGGKEDAIFFGIMSVVAVVLSIVNP